MWKKAADNNDIKGNQSATQYVFQLEMNYSKLKRYIFFSIFCILFNHAVPTLAEPQYKSFSLTLSLGDLSDMTFGMLSPLPNTADIPEITVSLENKGASLGLALGYSINDRIEFQGSLHYSRSEIINDVGIGLVGVPLGRTNVSDTKCFYYCGNILFYFSRNRTSPFVIIGLGLYSFFQLSKRFRGVFPSHLFPQL